MFGRKQKGYTTLELFIVLFWIFMLAIKIAVIGVVVWAIYKLVVHFTTSPAATAMLDTAVTYLS